MIYALIDNTNHVAALQELEDESKWFYPEGYKVVEANGFDPQNEIYKYKYENGEFILDEDLPPEQMNPIEILSLLIKDANDLDVDDEDAVRIVDFYPAWSSDAVVYESEYKVTYSDSLYRCITPHTSQPTWTPTDAPSLWAKVLPGQEGSDDTIGEWEQPDSTNPYMKGDKVMHNGKKWICDIDNNVWEPGIYGWSELTEEK